MELTDEQRELSKNDKLLVSVVRVLLPELAEEVEKRLIELLSSEQAWKEEAEKYERLFDGEMELRHHWLDEAHEAKDQLNQAVEVLNDLDAHMDFSEEMISGEGMGFEDASGINAVFSRAREFLSSLSQGTEGKP